MTAVLPRPISLNPLTNWAGPYGLPAFRAVCQKTILQRQSRPALRAGTGDRAIAGKSGSHPNMRTTLPAWNSRQAACRVL